MNRPFKNNRSKRKPLAKKGSLPTEGILRFDQYVGDLAMQETRSITVTTPEPGLPLGNYGFIEFYCADPTCDCRRAILHVCAEHSPGKTLAIIGYGWEDQQFYIDWMRQDTEMSRNMNGANLELMQPQSKYANALLQVFKNVVMRDEAYLQRLETHYALAKKKQGAK